jgi:hypothetical protein
MKSEIYALDRTLDIEYLKTPEDEIANLCT